MDERLALAAQKIKEADAILVGAGSGLSSSSGYNHYHFKGSFADHFSDFHQHYGFDSLMKGFYYCYAEPEQQWAFYARYIQFMRNAKVGQPYIDLAEILEGRNFFILTSNVDMQFSKVFPEKKIFYYQGDFRYFQCSQPCHDKIYNNCEIVDEMISLTKNFEIPTDRIPRCPICGWKMVPWVQDDTFLRGKDWEEQNCMFMSFVEKYRNKKLLLLELGVGDMTPSIIELPFWNMAANYPDTFLLNVNLAQTTPPLHLKGKMEYYCMDIAAFTAELRKEMEV